MKKSLGFLLLPSLLFGCSDKDFSTSSPALAQEIESNYLDGYGANPQVPDDRTLLTVGQSIKDAKGEATLQKINLKEQTVKVGDIKLTVKDTKLIHLFPDYSLTDYFHSLTHDEEFDYVKLFVEIKNSSTQKVNFAPIAMIETNTGQKITWDQDIYLENLNEVIEGSASKKGNLGFIVDTKTNLEWIEITTSDVFDGNEAKVANAKKFRIYF
ncbi:hypothetical protein [Viridibacillus sp. FSL H8-0123]|uniref:hypothetical protein n=1 Tax=Viridibacillus sp. FSL H8-0123 TaxID=1928922 RepID=UPI00096DEB2A|nr:hypothetical protein [Viridibacillus sp. FSL H8-0123]OMC83300.1 hypothetical protein BK130_07040 [Viridibacillus sp. FSL H8-0123]